MQHARKVTGAVALTFAALTMTGGLAGVAGAASASNTEWVASAPW